MRVRGKKIEKLRISEGASRHEVELRFDKEKGDFFAQLGGEWFSAMTLDELKTALQTKAKSMVSYEYKWFIEIKMDVDRAHNFRHSFGSKIGDRDDDDRRIVGINFDFHVVERSQVIECEEADSYGYRGAKRKYKMYMECEVEDRDGVLVPVGRHEPQRVHSSGFHKHADEDEILSYTPDRYAKLMQIREGMKMLAERLHSIVGVDSKQVAKILDGLTSTPLALPAASEAPVKKRKA